MSSWLNTIYRGIYDGLASHASNSLDDPMRIPAGDITNSDVGIMIIKAYKESGQAEADYKAYVTELHIYESIVSPAVYCTMIIKDAIGLSEYFKLAERDIVHVKFQTPGAETCEYIFKVNKPEISKTRSPNLAFDVYTAELVSIYAFEAQEVDMENFDLKDTAGNIIKKILEQKVETLGEVTKTTPMREYAAGHYIDTGTGIIGRNRLQAKRLPKNTNGFLRRPFEVIHQLALLNNMSPEGDSLYTFFEREDGFWFKPIEKLIRDGKKLIQQGRSDKIFYYDSLRNQAAEAVKFRNILAYSILNSGDGTSETNTVARTSNPSTGEVSTTAKADIDQNITELTSAEALKRHDIPVAAGLITSDAFDHLNNVIVKRQQYISRIGQYEAQMMIYGDTNMSVGDVIECNFPRAMGTESSSTDKNQKDSLSKDAAPYLITHLRHIVLNTSRPQHAITCNLMRAETIDKK
jgi:hypothetical protein